MLKNFRHFKAGPDPFGRVWQVDLLWLQTAVAIRHSDSVDVKFLLSDGETRKEKVIALDHPALLELSRKAGRPLTDPWCMKLAALHLIRIVETGADMDKTLVTVNPEEMALDSALTES
jgi:hypothetical protein